MLYTELTKKAMKIAFEVHKDQLDKNGIPYIYHPTHLAEQMSTEYEICVAFLHDTVEDGDITFDDLIEAGFPDEVIAALRRMTHDENVPYMEYIEKIRNNPIAKVVKLADLRHNSDLTRLDHVTEKDLVRKKKYEQAIRLLSSLD